MTFLYTRSYSFQHSYSNTNIYTHTHTHTLHCILKFEKLLYGSRFFSSTSLLSLDLTPNLLNHQKLLSWVYFIHFDIKNPISVVFMTGYSLDDDITQCVVHNFELYLFFFLFHTSFVGSKLNHDIISKLN